MLGKVIRLITMNAAGLRALIECRTKSGSAETPYLFKLVSPNALLVASVPKIPKIKRIRLLKYCQTNIFRFLCDI